ncbi:MAG: hypothetical protein ACR5KV_00640 [Wolbachia sp.]
MPRIPLLILGAMNDTIVPQKFIYDNFDEDVKVVMHSRNYHSLGLCEYYFVYEQIISFCNGITKEIHTEQF